MGEAPRTGAGVEAPEMEKASLGVATEGTIGGEAETISVAGLR